MTRRGVGAIFCMISAILFSTRYLIAAIFISNIQSWESEMYEIALKATSENPLIFLSIISLIIGLTYLVWGEISKKQE